MTSKGIYTFDEIDEIAEQIQLRGWQNDAKKVLNMYFKIRELVDTVHNLELDRDTYKDLYKMRGEARDRARLALKNAPVPYDGDASELNVTDREYAIWYNGWRSSGLGDN